MARVGKPLVMLFLVLAILSLPVTAMADPARIALNRERLTVPFTAGEAGVQTVNSYSGRVMVTVWGTGQAAGTQWSDAFYIFTDYDGNPVEPWHMPGFILWINGSPVDDFVRWIPPYNPLHVYMFLINVPEGLLNFGVGDLGVGDNTGEYQIIVQDVPG
jgi:hypothetical protein